MTSTSTSALESIELSNGVGRNRSSHNNSGLTSLSSTSNGNMSYAAKISSSSSTPRNPASNNQNAANSNSMNFQLYSQQQNEWNSMIPMNPIGVMNGHVSKKISLYKTEFCRTYEETGYCRYGLKCQFAHDVSELRTVVRHPRYKTEICKTFWELGNCPYGKRCCFIHTERPPNVPATNVPGDLRLEGQTEPAKHTEVPNPPPARRKSVAVMGRYNQQQQPQQQQQFSADEVDGLNCSSAEEEDKRSNAATSATVTPMMNPRVQFFAEPMNSSLHSSNEDIARHRNSVSIPITKEQIPKNLMERVATMLPVEPEDIEFCANTFEKTEETKDNKHHIGGMATASYSSVIESYQFPPVNSDEVAHASKQSVYEMFDQKFRKFSIQDDSPSPMLLSISRHHSFAVSGGSKFVYSSNFLKQEETTSPRSASVSFNLDQENSANIVINKKLDGNDIHPVGSQLINLDFGKEQIWSQNTGKGQQTKFCRIIGKDCIDPKYLKDTKINEIDIPDGLFELSQKRTRRASMMSPPTLTKRIKDETENAEFKSEDVCDHILSDILQSIDNPEICN